MGLATWLKQARHSRIEGKLKSLRTRQKHVRRKEESLQKERKAGTVAPEQAEERVRKLHEEKEKLTREINDLIAEEERLRAELEREGVVLAK